MPDITTPSHTKWDCKYYIVFIPKYHHKVLYTELRQYLGAVFHSLAEQKKCRIEDGHLMPDHIHMLLSIPPKHFVAQVVDSSRGNWLFTWRGHLWDAVRTTRDTISGREDITSRPSGPQREGTHVVTKSGFDHRAIGR